LVISLFRKFHELIAQNLAGADYERSDEKHDTASNRLMKSKDRTP
jgi:hypothetical protein